MNGVLKKQAYSTPVDHSKVRSDWRDEGFSFGVFRDPPGQEWNGFVHNEDEYVIVADGRLRVGVGEEIMEAGPGDLIRIPAGVVHSLVTLSAQGSVWLYGYGHWENGNG